MGHRSSATGDEQEAAMTLGMAVAIGWGVFLVELCVLGWFLVRHNR
jgi:hypothetical protein